jgi:transcription elongation factor Elf1
LETNPQMSIVEAVTKHKISQLARKYGDELVGKVWKEIKTVGGDEAFFGLCGWKSEMTQMEALEGLDDYCDFVEAMIRRHQEKEKENRGSY